MSAGIVLVYANQYTSAVNQTVRQHASVEMQMNCVERCDEYARAAGGASDAAAARRAAVPAVAAGVAARSLRAAHARYAHGVSCGAGGALVAAGDGSGGGAAAAATAAAAAGWARSLAAASRRCAGERVGVVGRQARQVDARGRPSGCSSPRRARRDRRRRHVDARPGCAAALAIIRERRCSGQRARQRDRRARSDADVRAALAQVRLTVGFDHELRDMGANLSVGERQLLCLARCCSARASS